MYPLVCFFSIVILENDHQYFGMNLGHVNSTLLLHVFIMVLILFTPFYYALVFIVMFIMFCLPSYFATLVIHCGV
jgi:hypothetical protein